MVNIVKKKFVKRLQKFGPWSVILLSMTAFAIEPHIISIVPMIVGMCLLVIIKEQNNDK